MAFTPSYESQINWQNYPNTTTPIDEINLNKMDYAIYQHDRTLENWDITKANQSDMLVAVQSIVYNKSNGQLTITYFNGNTTIIDTDIEKIAVNFDYDDDPTSAHYQNLIITLDDGDPTADPPIPPTVKYVDLSALITQYEFEDTSTIHFTIGNDGSISANVIDGSITESKLQPNFLADCREQKTLAQAARQGAEAAENNAESSEEDAEAWANGTRNGVPVGPDDPTYHNNSYYWSTQSNPTTLEGMSDTDINQPANKQILRFNSSTGKWENEELDLTNLEIPGYFIQGPGHSIGTQSTAFPIHAEGASSTIYNGSDSAHVEGFSNFVYGKYAHAEGDLNSARGDSGHVEGHQNTAYSGHAEGANTTSMGEYAHSEGSETYADGDYSHAEGLKSAAYGVGSHSEGSISIDDDERSFNSAAITRSIPASDDEITLLEIPCVKNWVETLGGSIYNNGSMVSYFNYNAAVGMTLFTPNTILDSLLLSATMVFADPYNIYRITVRNLGSVAISVTNLTVSARITNKVGINTRSTGRGSHAEGIASVASSENSHAQGYKGMTGSQPLKFGFNEIVFAHGSGYKQNTLENFNNGKFLQLADNSPFNVFSMDNSGNFFTFGAQTMYRGYIDGVLVANGPEIVLEDGACYILYVNGRNKTNGQWRGAQTFVIDAPFNPLGTGQTATAQAVPHWQTLGSTGTTPISLAGRVQAYDDHGTTKYHAKLGIGSCTTAFGVRWNLVKVLGSEYDFGYEE